MDVSTKHEWGDSDGDEQALDEIFRLHHRRVYALCLRMTGNATEAEDLTQEVFIQVFRKWGSFRGESAFTTWLHRLTVNQVLMPPENYAHAREYSRGSGSIAR
jgi:RNA polymerase sigma factor (sigma-70 family)